MFTGRRVDILDNGSLKIQYNRNRYYDYYTGRWLSHDPLGINPAGAIANPFQPIAQYADGISLYEYSRSMPTGKVDPRALQACYYPEPPADPSTPAPPGPEPAWSTWDFLEHYFFGKDPYSLGDTIDLAEVGLLGKMKMAAAGVVTACKVRADAGAYAAGVLCGPDFVAGDCSQGIDATRYIFVVGDTMVHADYACWIVRDWPHCCFHYDCELTFSIDDWFADPTDTFELIEEDFEVPGGVPYPIVASWTETLIGAGPMRGVLF